MTGKRNRQISAIPCRCGSLGAQVERDGILFSAEVHLKAAASLILYRKGTEEILEEIPFPEQPCMGAVRSMKVKGISPRYLEYNFRIGNQVMVDPMARLVVGREEFGYSGERSEHQIRGGFVLPDFEWGTKERQPGIPYEDVISYQLHVRGFTKQKNSRVYHKGTFLGLQEKIPYLRELGVNQVILMPAYEFNEIMADRGIGRVPPSMKMENSLQGSTALGGASFLTDREEAGKKLNYWGYTPGYYFAPKAAYCATGRPDREFKSMVRAFHENGMEVVMQFCFPDPVDLTMVNDCLVWWLQEYHVDGFHLMMNQEAANRVARNPFLETVKRISGYFPVSQLYPEGKQIAVRTLAEYHDGFKTDVRRILKGDEDMLPAFTGRMRYNPQESGVINYITDHDGFTLLDLVSYDKKHNEENGELGQDGPAYNYSWNCGAEGSTRKKKILELRLRQMKNALAVLLLAQGTPMILAGDEFGNSQGGNNNPYCLDSPVSWVDWSREKAGEELKEFVKELIRFRKEHRILHMGQPLAGGDTRSIGYPDISWHGSRAWYGGFEPANRHVGIMYCGQYAGQEEFIYIACNFHWEPQKMALPYLPEGLGWKKVLDTDRAQGEENLLPRREFTVPSRCVQILVSSRMKKKNGDNKTEMKTESMAAGKSQD